MRSILLLLTIFTTLLSSSQEISGTWHFNRIVNDSNQLVKETSATDSLQILEDGTFFYQIENLNLVAKGIWKQVHDSLIFLYQQPSDTLRNYKVLQADSILSLQEGTTFYHFDKSQQSTLPKLLPEQKRVQTSRISQILRGILGITVLLALAWACSTNRRKVDWLLVGKALAIQILFAFLILKVGWIQSGFEWLSSGFVQILAFTGEGSAFLFGGLVADTKSFGYIFAFQVLPTIIFFSALTSLLFYFGILQKVVFGFAWIMRKTLKLSGAESLAAAGNIFLGQTEAPLLVKPYVDKMTKSELFCLMSGGMATIAGGVLAAYIGFLGGEDIQGQIYFAKHLLAASVMSAPAAILAAKILIPETEPINTEMSISKSSIGSNVLDAISNGTIQGIKLAVNVGAMLLVFLAFVAMLNYVMSNGIGRIGSINDWVFDVSNGRYEVLSLQFLLAHIFAPFSWILGVHAQDSLLVGQLLGEKTILNEFVAYISLGEMKNNGEFFDNKSVIIATYLLCGFANFASIGIQIGGIGALAPKRRALLSALGFRALIAGTLACMFTAVIVGMIV